MILSGPTPSHAPKWDDLVAMLREASAGDPARGVYILSGEGTKEFRSWAELYARSAQVAGALGRTLAPRTRVVVRMNTQFSFLHAFFGCIGAGMIPVPLSAPRPSHPDPMGQLQSLGRFARRLNATAVLYDRSLGLAHRPATGGAFTAAWELEALLRKSPGAGGDEEAFGAHVSELAYIQPTAGSTGHVRAVGLTHRNILSNIVAVSQALEMTPQDLGVCWLPLDNVMSLVGFVLMSAYWGLDAVLMDPARFVSHPQDWFCAIDAHRATITAAPDFAYFHCTRRVRASTLEGLDLSSLRVAMCGGEPVRAQHLDSFFGRFRDYGLSERAFMPVYGLAEATLGVAFEQLGGPFDIDGVNRRTLERDDRAEPLGPEGAPTPYERMHLVSVGAPIAGVDVAVFRDGQVVDAQREIGEIGLRGPNVMAGYMDAPNPDTASRATTRQGDWLLTGDLGYIAGGRLYVVDRMHDSPRVEGRRFLPSEVELFVDSVDGVRAGTSVAFVSKGRIVVACEIQLGADAHELEIEVRRLLKRHLNIVPDEVLCLEPSSVPKTRQGSVRRHHARQFYDRGQLELAERSNELQGLWRLANRARSDALRLSERVKQKLGWWTDKS